jgi:biopolymer transport protein ExbD
MPLKTTQDELPSFNLTSMIDVVFLLLIFSEGNIELEVPKVSGVSSLIAPPESRTIQVGKDGDVFLDGKGLSLAELKMQLQTAKAQYEDISVVVRADAKSSYERVAEVLGVCSDSKVKINLGFRPGSVVR